MTDSSAWRRFFAEEIQIVANIRTPAIVDALATIPREAFLPPGPWTVRGEGDIKSGPRLTPGDDPRFASHNVAVGIEPERMLFNGAPGLLAMAIDALEPKAGDHALHIGDDGLDDAARVRRGHRLHGRGDAHFSASAFSAAVITSSR